MHKFENSADVDIDEDKASKLVSDYINDRGEWSWETIRSFLPEDCLSFFHSIKTPKVTMGHDLVAWLNSTTGDFSVKSTYNCWKDEGTNHISNLFKAVWRVKAPHRIQHFLWLVSNNALLTTQGRCRRGMTDEDTCQVCGCESETVLHILRDCPVVKEMWMSIGHRCGLKILLGIIFTFCMGQTGLYLLPPFLAIYGFTEIK